MKSLCCSAPIRSSSISGAMGRSVSSNSFCCNAIGEKGNEMVVVLSSAVENYCESVWQLFKDSLLYNWGKLNMKLRRDYEGTGLRLIIPLAKALSTSDMA